MMIPGIKLYMGGREWIVPPLTLGQLRRLLPPLQQLGEIGAAMGEAQIGVLVEIVTAALKRNYPELTPGRVEELLDLGNAGAVLNAVLTGSGLRPAGEVPAPGTGPSPGAEPARPAGATSTGSSPPPAATVTP